MRATLPALLAAALLAATPPAAGADTPAPAQLLAIVELLPDPAAGAREFVEIHNRGNATAELAGHKLRDAGGSTFTFPAWSLAPGARVVVWGGGAGDAFGPAWSLATVWNNGGDRAELLAPDGTVLDSVAYGTGTPLRAPPKGKAIAHDGTKWVEAEPTPGTGPGQPMGAVIDVEVANVAPEATIALASTHAEPGATVLATVRVSDANGPQDVHWTLQDGAQVLAEGRGGTHEVPVTARSTPVRLRLVATDEAGLVAQAEATLQPLLGLTVILPPEGLGFPAFTPGAKSVAAARPFEVRNPDERTLLPRLDVSDLRGAGGSLPVAGHLQVGWQVGNTTTWIAYSGPLTALPEMPPGTAAKVWLRYQDVPAPMPAGRYGASFTVVA
ncbi:MAG TPA: lamin tail domain-containing protein [Candidatus Thermoplasmatota archaeon]|nr:lamin tail domain-containing protein [Candidatus Thermoplasmatota archaeon]